jgi:Asp-tRNA(Asn)/Glu-tRNA(Gln) amidotransferase A subunit family amidase/Asp-tRNA(Asn)/Glu-tRNA(Gln) amidotransferase C subunit
MTGPPGAAATPVAAHATAADGDAARVPDRRAFLSYFSAIGLGGTLFPGVLWARAAQEPVTKELIAQAERIAGLSFTDEEREAMVNGLNGNVRAWEQLRAVELDNAVPPALHFDPVLPGMTVRHDTGTARPGPAPAVRRPDRLEDVAYWPLRALAELVRTRQVTATELTTMYLDRLRRFDGELRAVVTLTERRALAQAEQADREIAAGRYRGPLHGLPWGAKDLLATRGYPTTWGAAPYRDQVIDEDATVVQRLDAAGAILVAKLTLGALAQGDQWFGGRTNNPWNVEQGSSGSSAGPGAATAAGCVAFSIGTETLGSIVSPSTRNGVTGLRPTYGRVSRHGAMALSWSMDKVGPMCRSAEDCALVFDAIHGGDGRDATARSLPFVWDATRTLGSLRIGWFRSAFEQAESEADRRRKPFDDATLDVLRRLGAELVPVELPADLPLNAMRAAILSAEAGAAFDGLTRSGRVNEIERSSWPNAFRQARFIPAVEYINANRLRTLAMQAMAEAMAGLDVLVTPSFGGNVLLLTNLTGHPAVCLPNGFTDEGTPVSISFIGRLFGEADLLAAAKAYQDATDFHGRRPPGFA